jgi:hypothetical protein
MEVQEVLKHQIEEQEVQNHERQVLALLCNPTEGGAGL